MRATDDEHGELRGRLVGRLESAGVIRSAAIAEAFRTVPRHQFLPGVEPERAYRDEAIVTKVDAAGRPASSSSQPAIMAVMLEQLALRPGLRVLEIGAGTGYNAALIAHLVGAQGKVVTIELDAEVAEAARRNLGTARVSGVDVVQADGALGWPEAAPYDRIILTVGASDVAPAWRDQLAPAGRLVLPLSLRGAQRCIALARANGHLESLSVENCGFMPLRGVLAGPERIVPLGPEKGILVRSEGPRPPAEDPLYAALTAPADDVATGVRVTAADLWGGLGLWLALREENWGWLVALGPAVERGLVPPLMSLPGQVMTGVVIADAALAALVRFGPDHGSSDFELGVRPLGSGGVEVARALVAQVQAWDASGRSSGASLRVRVYGLDTGEIAAADALIETRHARIALDWLPRT